MPMKHETIEVDAATAAVLKECAASRGVTVSEVVAELAASAAINQNRSDRPLQTGSLRVNFLRPFFAGDESRYQGTRLRVGRSTAIGDAQALGDDAKVAITARVTAYR